MVAAVVMNALIEQVAAPERKVVFSADGAVQRVFVIEDKGLLTLRFDDVDRGDDQSALDLKDPDRVVFEYARLAGLALGLVEPRQVLVIGLGGGAFPRLVLKRVPGAHVDAVEIDPVVIEVAHQFFQLPRDPRLTVINADGAGFVGRSTHSTHPVYDLILLDAFSGDGIPKSLASAAFFDDVHRSLSPEGIAVMNVALESDDEIAAITRRFRQAFSTCVKVTGKADDNHVLFASKRRLSVMDLKRAIATSSTRLGFDVDGDVKTVTPCTPMPSTSPPPAAGTPSKPDMTPHK